MSRRCHVTDLWVSIVWDSPVTGRKEKISYAKLEEEVCILAGALREEGVKKGDVVIIYMPMMPAALFGMLAVARLGAIHAVVFGGFSASSLAQRIDSSKPKAILTASCGIEGAKGPLPYQPMVRGAIEQAEHKPFKVLIWQRDEHRWDNTDRLGGERTWQRVVKSARDRGVRAENVPVKSNDSLYIIYTSGESLCQQGYYLVQAQLTNRKAQPDYPKALLEKQEDMLWALTLQFVMSLEFEVQVM